MIRNYFKIALRNFKNRPFYGLANILGLTLGLASCGLIGLYIYGEWQVDRFHQDANQLYRVVSDIKPPTGDAYIISTVGRPIAYTIEQEVPEIESVLGMRSLGVSIYHEEEYFFEDLFMADEDFWDFFNFPLVEGDPNTALKEPFSLVITQSLQKKLFGDESAMGKQLVAPWVNDTLLLKVTGIVADIPRSHIEFDGLVSLSSFYALGGSREQWFTLDETCYVKLKTNSDKAAAEEKIAAIPMKHQRELFEQYGYHIAHQLQAVSDIYLFSKTASSLGSIGDASRLYLLGTIALLILIIACINFINLTTARISDRAREVGIRKTIGASYQSLIAQFLGEGLIYAFMAAVLAVFLIESALPYFRELLETDISLNILFTPVVFVPAILFVIATGLIAGWYPALVQARLRPIDTLKGRLSPNMSSGKLRKILVVFQFCISVILIFSTLVIFRQINYMQVQELGFQKDQMLVIDARRSPKKQLAANFETIKQELQTIPGVEEVGGAWALPGRTGWGGQVVKPEDMPEEITFSMEVIPVDHDYIKTLGLQLIQGRDFSKELTTDLKSSVILNEKACKAIGWTPEEAIGKKVWTSGIKDGKVIGVMADYHHHGLQSEVHPMLLFVGNYGMNFLALNTVSPNYQTMLSQAQEQWANWFPGYPFEYFFLDDDFDRQYQSEKRLFKAFGIFAFLSIFTACLGLLGLAVYTAEKRTKEIGIRKVMGASVQQIVQLLSSDFLRLVAIALLLAFPIGWYAMHKWLLDFAYRTPIDWWVFVLSGGMVLFIAIGTISFQAYRAAVANPVESLRDE